MVPRRTTGPRARRATGWYTTADGASFWVAPGETIALSHVAVHLDPSAWGADAAAYNPRRPQWASDPPPDEYMHTTF